MDLHWSSIVPNLTFWFNDLILQRSRSLHKNYSDPRDGHSMELGGAPKEGKGGLTSLTWGQRAETSGGLVSGWERFFSCLQSTTAHAHHRRAPPAAIFDWTCNVVLLLATQTMDFFGVWFMTICIALQTMDSKGGRIHTYCVGCRDFGFFCSKGPLAP